MVGFHPEGTRNQGPDPYELLPAKPGCGELIHRANPNVVPVFVQGFPPSLFAMIRNNGKQNGQNMPYVHMVMGEPMDFSTELQMEASNKTYLKISQKVMEKINALAREEKRIRQEVEQGKSSVVNS